MRLTNSIRPAPVAYVSVKSAGIDIHNVPMLIDTGADVSLLPAITGRIAHPR